MALVKPWIGGPLLLILGVALAVLLDPVGSFIPHSYPQTCAQGPRPWRQKERSPVVMMAGGWSGTGRVDNRYSWTENEYEIEIIIPVPEGTRKDDVLFSAGVRNVKLGLVGSTKLLLGGELKGRIALDGSYWSLEDSDDEGDGRQIRLLLEKKDGAPENAMDWRRVIIEEPATESSYGLPSGNQPWDPKEYVEQMLGPAGVNVSMVDKTMFGSGGVMSNVSKDSLQDYVKQGVMVDAVSRVPGSDAGLLPKLDEEEGDEEKGT